VVGARGSTMGLVHRRRLKEVVPVEGVRGTPSLASWGQHSTGAVEFAGRLVIVHAVMERTTCRSLLILR
jgi:hypothetical protein